MSLFIKNPHSVLAALETRPQDVLEVVIAPKETEANDIWQQIRQLATRSRIPVSAQPRKDHGGKNFSKNKAVTRPDESSRLSGTGASIKERAGLSVEELFRVGPANGDTATVPAKLSPASSKSGRSSKSLSAAAGHGIWLALDSLQDPQNVGAIFRSAAFFGVRGILLTQERSVPLTAAVYDIASGGAEYVPFSIQANLQRSFEIAKDAGLWILGTSEHAHDSFLKVERDRPWLIVLGNEEKGMRRLTEESCDVLCGIPPIGKVESLNVSVAAGILLSHFIS